MLPPLLQKLQWGLHSSAWSALSCWQSAGRHCTGAAHGVGTDVRAVLPGLLDAHRMPLGTGVFRTWLLL